MQWVGTSPLNTRYIPDFDVMGEHINCVHQIEPFISRPAGKARADHVAHRLSLGKRTSPLLSYNSIGWNRRHYEPVPDASLANANRPAFGSGTAMRHEDLRNASFASRQSSISRPASRSFSGASDGSPVPPLTPDEREREYLEGYASSPMGSGNAFLDFEPPRIEGVDTHSRPPLVVHSSHKVRRPAWIGTRY